VRDLLVHLMKLMAAMTWKRIYRSAMQKHIRLTATSLANGKSQKAKDMATSSTPSNSPRTPPKVGHIFYITTLTNLGKPPSACDSSAMESAILNVTSRIWIPTKSPNQSKTKSLLAFTKSSHDSRSHQPLRRWDRHSPKMSSKVFTPAVRPTLAD
jgi:hypothetical protein